MTATEKKLAEFAQSHGFDFASVQPDDKQARSTRLKENSFSKRCAFPISPERQAKYLEDFENDIPFGVGSLSDVSVDLKQYGKRPKVSRIYAGRTSKLGMPDC